MEKRETATRWTRRPGSFVLTVALALLVVPGVVLGDLIITEIHYDPVDGNGQPLQQLEFVEIYNDGPEPFDLLGFRFVKGITYEFDRYILDGRSFVVVAKDANAITSRYGIANVVGNFSGVLDNSGESLALANPQGRVICEVDYNDRGTWPAAAKGTGHSLSILYEYSDPGEPESWAISTRFGGTPGLKNFNTDVSFVDTTIIAVGESWRYFKGNSEASTPTTAWRQLAFSDGSWPTGPTGIGYGDGDDATVLDDMQNSYLTVFMRKTFQVADVDEIDSLVLSIGYDDGFVAYLNGTEVTSRNVAGGRAFDDTATGVVDNADFEDIDITAFKNRLVNGTNVLAIQVHNTSLNSSDLSCLPALVSRRAVEPEEIATVPVVINEGYFRTGGTRFIELYNTGSSTVDLSGYYLTDDFAFLGKAEIPANTLIQARGRVAFTEAELGLDFSIVPVTRERVSIALTNRALTRVVDAYIFEPKVDGRSEARIPDGDRRFMPAAEPTQGTANAVTVPRDIVINEIMYSPLSFDENGDFVELFNRGSTNVDMSGWELEGVGGLTFPPGTSLAPGAYLVLCKNPLSIRQAYGLPAAAVLGVGWLGSLSNGGERLRLVDANGNTADTVRFYDGGYWPRWADGNGSSLELIDPWSDNEVAGSWDASDDSDKAQTVTVTHSNVPYGGGESDFQLMLADEGIAIIDDISLTRSGSATNLISNGSFDSTTSPWRIQGTHSRSGRTTDPAERIGGAGSLKLISWNGGGDYKINRLETETSSQTSGSYTVSYRARWVVGSNRVVNFGDYSSSQPQTAPLAGSTQLPVPIDPGTPGGRNSVTSRQIAATGAANVGPAIDRVTHDPGVPENGETVTVSARITDRDGVILARLYFRTNTISGAFTERTLSDPDGDGVYTGTIPGQSLGTRVIYYIEASDGGGITSRFPPDVFARTHPPVVNEAAAEPWAQDYAIYRHDTRNLSTSRHAFRFILNEEAENYLASRPVLSNEMLDGTFVFGSGDVYYNARLRFAGSPWLRPSGGGFERSYSLRLPKDKPLHGRRETLNLDERGADGRERLCMYLIRMNAGSALVPYFPFQALVQFELNDVRSGTYESLAKPNGDYLDVWYDGPLGELFEMDDRFEFNDSGSREGNNEARVLYPPYGSDAGGSNKENYRWYFAPRAGKNKTKDEYSGLMAFANLMDPGNTGTAAFDSAIWNNVAVEEVLRLWAIELNVDNWDTWVGNRGKNGYLYRWPIDGRWRKVPFDLELTFGNVNAFGMPSSISQTYSNHFGEITRMLNRPQIKRMYYGILAEAVDNATGFFQSSFLTTYTQRLAAASVGNLGAANPGGWIDQRANLIRNWIRSSVYPQVRLSITTNNGNGFIASGPTVELSGNAPVDVFFLSVSRNGIPVDDDALEVSFSSSDFTGWTISDIPLAGGVNDLQVFGFGSDGALVDMDSIAVTSTVEWDAPVIDDVDPGSASAAETIVITGSEFHEGVRVFFGSLIQATDVTFDEGDDPTRITVVVPDSVVEGLTTVEVRNIDGQTSNPILFTVLPPAPQFLRGDANMDTRLEVSDGVKVLRYLYHGALVDCLDALDADDSGDIVITDALFILNHILLRATAPAAPYPAIGRDPSNGDPLDCERGL